MDSCTKHSTVFTPRLRLGLSRKNENPVVRRELRSEWGIHIPYIFPRNIPYNIWDSEAIKKLEGSDSDRLG